MSCQRSCPPPPALNRLTLTTDKKELRLPADLVQKWSMHPAHGTEFTGWLDSFLAIAEYKILDPEAEMKLKEEVLQDGSPTKRNSSSGAGRGG